MQTTSKKIFNPPTYTDILYSEEIGAARALYGRLASDDTQVANALAWFAAEEVARSIVDAE